jgi:hypothetical protein
MVDAGSYFNSGNSGGFSQLLMGKMFQSKGLQHDENHGAF